MAAPSLQRLPRLADLPQRLVVCQEALTWLEQCVDVLPGSCITSVPDVSETRLNFEAYVDFFGRACAAIMRKLEPRQVAIFYQTDIKFGGHWIDKGYLATKAAEAAGCSMLWHKIVLINPPGTVRYGRPSYSHMLCFSKSRQEPTSFPSVDVLPNRGAMIWVRGMGLDACDMAVKYCRDRVGAECIVDPFCGMGSVLAIANEYGLKAVGVDLSIRRARSARVLTAETFRGLAARGIMDTKRKKGAKSAESTVAAANVTAPRPLDETPVSENENDAEDEEEGENELHALADELSALGKMDS